MARARRRGPMRTGVSLRFRLAPGLCKLVEGGDQSAARAPARMAGGGCRRTSRSAISASPTSCPPKSPLLPICTGEQTNGPALPTGDGDDGRHLQRRRAAGADAERALPGDGPLASHARRVRTDGVGDRAEPVAQRSRVQADVRGLHVPARTTAAGLHQPDDGRSRRPTSTSASRATVQREDRRRSSTAGPRPTWRASSESARAPGGDAVRRRHLQARDRLPARQGAAEHRGGDVLREPGARRDQRLQPAARGAAPRCRAALEAEILAAYNATPSLQTYFVVLDDDAHDTARPRGADVLQEGAGGPAAGRPGRSTPRRPAT